MVVPCFSNAIKNRNIPRIDSEISTDASESGWGAIYSIAPIGVDLVTEWRLSPAIFHKILRVFYCKPEIDLFASCLNFQIPKYVSWHSDKNAVVVDAFSISWPSLDFYAFPPFSLNRSSCHKNQSGAVLRGTMPYHCGKHKFGLQLLINFPVLLLPPNILNLSSNKSVQHRLYQKMKLLPIELPDRHSETQVFYQKLLPLSQIQGEQQQPKIDMNWYSDNGLYMLHQGI